MIQNGNHHIGSMSPEPQPQLLGLCNPTRSERYFHSYCRICQSADARTEEVAGAAFASCYGWSRVEMLALHC
jgi:hypothetical protein